MSGTASDKPAPWRPNAYLETAHTFDVEGVRFPAVMCGPATPVLPACRVVLIGGSIHADVDGNVPSRGQHQHTYADLARQLASLGHHVLRFAKHGPETGTLVRDPERAARHAHFATRLTVARAAIDLAMRLAPAPRSTALAGHSEGSIVATLVAAQRQRDVQALICLSGPAGRRLDNMREQVAERLGGARPEALDAYDTAVAALRRGDGVPAGIADRDPTGVVAAIADDPRIASFQREVDAIDPAEELAKVAAPTLIVQGGADRIVAPWHARALAEARRRASRSTGEAFFPDLTHMYKRAPTEADADGSAQDEVSDPRVAAAMDAWLRSLSLDGAPAG